MRTTDESVKAALGLKKKGLVVEPPKCICTPLRIGPFITVEPDCEIHSPLFGFDPGFAQKQSHHDNAVKAGC